jgi:hypothetical protein
VPEPVSLEEYNRLFAQRTRIDGYGLDVTTVIPCPFCSASDFASWRIVSCHEDMGREATCRECGRSARTLVATDGSATTGELVQTGGPPPPDWLVPTPRRIDPRTEPTEETRTSKGRPASRHPHR